MSDGWCEKCWKRASVRDSQGRYTYRCDVCGPEETQPIPVIPVDSKGRSLWKPNRAERRKMKSDIRRGFK
jgi:hypothetical protein